MDGGRQRSFYAKHEIYKPHGKMMYKKKAIPPPFFFKYVTE